MQTPDGPKKKPLLLLDLDGTLVGSSHGIVTLKFIWKSLIAIRRETRVGWWRAFQSLLATRTVSGQPVPDHEEGHEQNTNGSRAVQAFAAATGLGLDQAATALGRVMSEALLALEEHFYPIEGAKEFLIWASQSGYTLILATNPVWPLELVHARIRWGGLEPSQFEWISHAEIMHACKPADRYYRQVLEHLNLQANDCVMIGNEWVNDLSATRLGIPSFLIQQSSEKPFRKVTPPEGAQAEAWTGNWSDLRTWLLGFSKVREPTLEPS